MFAELYFEQLESRRLARPTLIGRLVGCAGVVVFALVLVCLGSLDCFPCILLRVVALIVAFVLSVLVVVCIIWFVLGRSVFCLLLRADVNRLQVQKIECGAQ